MSQSKQDQASSSWGFSIYISGTDNGERWVTLQTSLPTSKRTGRYRLSASDPQDLEKLNKVLQSLGCSLQEVEGLLLR